MKETQTIIVTNIPPTSSPLDVRNYFSEIGPVKKSFCVRKEATGSLNGLAYITYASVEDATRAVHNLNKKEFSGSVLHVKFPQKRGRKTRPCKTKVVTFVENELLKEKKRNTQNRPPFKKLNKEEKKVLQKKSNAKKGRMILRNLSFKADEKKVEEHFKKFGKISEVKILRKENGLMVGCAFVQFDSIFSARKAIKECNLKEFLGRVISVDLAFSKSKYNEIVETNPNTEVVPEIKLEQADDFVEHFEDSKTEESLKLAGDGITPDEKIKVENDNNDIKSEVFDSGIEDAEVVGETKESQSVHKFSSHGSRDVQEGRTLFIQGLSFNSSADDIERFFQRYGEVKYVLPCIDRLTELSRGKAFVQFNEKESAEKCLSAFEEEKTKGYFMIDGRYIFVSKALSRDDINKKKEEEVKPKVKDKRNLYLTREGMIREGTKAAEGISSHDLLLHAKRAKLRYSLLKNLHMFVSPTRLRIGNLPLNLTDKNLRDIVLSHAPDDAKLLEVRIMRNLKKIGLNDLPQSRGFGYLAFDKAEDALAVLRAMNNNPAIFTVNKRPVVEFSIENMKAIAVKEKRKKKSLEKNPTVAASSRKKRKIASVPETFVNNAVDAKDQNCYFMGTKVNPEMKLTMPRHSGPKIRHQSRAATSFDARRPIQKRPLERLRDTYKAKRLPRIPTPQSSRSEVSQEKKRRGKSRPMDLNEEEKFLKMVAKYKELTSDAFEARKRWFEA